MKTRRLLAFLGALMLIAGLAYAGWMSVTADPHRVIVVLPDGTRAPNPSVFLDYDPVYTYQPTRLTGSKSGIVFIPRQQAYGQGWDWMSISVSVGDRHYAAIRYPKDCKYPMTAVLDEVKPVPRQRFLQQLGGLLHIVKQVLR